MIRASRCDAAGHRRAAIRPRAGRTLPTAALAVLLLSSGANLAQSVLFVDDSATGSNDGSSWCDAFVNLQDALDAARASGGLVAEIRVAEGVYRPDDGGSVTPGDRAASFELIGSVALRGGYAGCPAPDPDARSIGLYATVLSGDLQGNDVAAEFPGGASFADNSYHVATSAGAGTALLEGITIKAGRADGASPGDTGGALYVESGSSRLERCTLVGNFASRGGAIHNSGGSVALVDSLLAGNAAALWGGAIDSFSARASLVDCLLIGNTSAGEGGAFHSDLSTLTLANCTLSANTAGNRGGGVFNYAGVLAVLTNTILWGNRDGSGGGEPAQIYSNPSNAVEINHSCVEGWTGSFGGVGNIGDDPLFGRDPAPGSDHAWNGVDDDYGDLHLREVSPGIDAGDNDADTDAHEPGVQPLPASDYDGHARIAGGAIDMGAYEHQPPEHEIPALSAEGIALLVLLVMVSGVTLLARRGGGPQEPAAADRGPTT